MADRVDLVTAAVAGLIVAAGVNPDGARLRDGDELRDQKKAYVDPSDDGAP